MLSIAARNRRRHGSAPPGGGRARAVIPGDDPIAIYLNDHLAGSTVGLQVARRAAAENRGNDFGEFLSQLADEIETDRRELERVMDSLGVGRDRLKRLAAWTGE